MRFWITRGSELSIREQLVRQVMLGILSDDLPAGRKLPSVRAVARRHRVHANTVSAAYHDLLQQGWLELRRGSGLYVRSLNRSADAENGLDRLLAETLQAAAQQGHAAEEVLARMMQLVRPHALDRITIVEPDPAMREILVAELGRLGIPVEARENPAGAGGLVVALPTRMAHIGPGLPIHARRLTLRLRSLSDALAGEAMPGARAILTVVSRSHEIRLWTRAVLISVGIDGDCITEADPAEAGWADRFRLSAIVIADVVAERELPVGVNCRALRVIADSSLDELKRLCG
jgi:DNA-binding transcriptional regulator YhcF (GntR family)